MAHNFCEVSAAFPTLLRRLRDPLQLRASEVVVQFPFVMPVTEEKTEEELARIAERRKEQGKKLQEIAANKRMEKVSFDFVSELRNYTFASAFAKGERPSVSDRSQSCKGYGE